MSWLVAVSLALSTKLVLRLLVVLHGMLLLPMLLLLAVLLQLRFFLFGCICLLRPLHPILHWPLSACLAVAGLKMLHTVLRLLGARAVLGRSIATHSCMLLLRHA